MNKPSSNQRVAQVTLGNGRQRVAMVRGQSLLIDPLEEGDGGFKSGELLLMALGSCVAGGLRTYCEKASLTSEGLWVEVRHTPNEASSEPSEIVVTLGMHKPAHPDEAESLLKTALSGNVARRLARCGNLKVRFEEN